MKLNKPERDYILKLLINQKIKDEKYIRDNLKPTVDDLFLSVENELKMTHSLINRYSKEVTV